MNPNATLAMNPKAKLAMNPDKQKISANIKLLEHMQQKIIEHDDGFFLPSVCKQHSASLCVVPTAKDLDIICPAFCTAKSMMEGQFNSRFLDSILTLVEQDLKWVQAFCFGSFSTLCMQHVCCSKTASEHPDFRPDPQHVAFAEELLDATYYKHVGNRQDADDEDCGLRRERGEKLREACQIKLI